MKKVLNILGTVVMVAVIGVLAYLKWWNVAGQNKLGESCSGRAGCRSFYCLEHEFAGKTERKSDGYCTDSCDTDADCTDNLRCVVPTQLALDDLPGHGRPKKLCERTLPGTP